MKRRVFAYVCLAQCCSMFDYISYMLLDVLYTFVFAEKNYCIFWKKEMRDLMIFLTCFYIELASIKFVLSSVHQNNYKTKDRLTNSLIVFWQFSFTYIFGSRESGVGSRGFSRSRESESLFKIVRSRESESLWKSPTPRPCV